MKINLLKINNVSIFIFVFIIFFGVFFQKEVVFASTPGCTDSNAINYYASADVDDGSCYYVSFLPMSFATTTINVWPPVVYWTTSSVCQYSYDNISYSNVSCLESGSDIPAPSNTGSTTLYIKSDIQPVATSTHFIYSTNPRWSALTGAEPSSWYKIRNSSDGAKIYAGSSLGYVKKSADYGGTWTELTSAGSGIWWGLGISSDGSQVVLGDHPLGFTPAQLKISTDSGVNWTTITEAGRRWWRGVVTSSDGSKIAAVADANGVGDYIMLSSNGGSTWATSTTAGSRVWYGIDSSSDGTKLAAVVYGGYIYTSGDSGSTWTARTGAGSRNWRAITSSSDGTKLAAVVYDGYIYISGDSGANWTEITATSSQFTSIDSSADGTKLVAVSSDILISKDSGNTWIAQNGIGDIYYEDASISSDGSRIVVSSANHSFVGDGYLYEIAFDTTSPTISGINSSVASSSATITWTTNESSSSQIVYGLSSSYSATTTESDTITRTTSHSVQISNLVPCVTYHFQVRSSDDSQNTGTSSDQTFSTSGCTGDAPVTTSTTTNPITSASGGTASLTSSGTGITITIPVSFTSSTSARFSISKLDSDTLLNSIESPSTLYSIVDSYTYEIEALPTATTSISTFDNPLTISIAYTHNEIEGIEESSLRIYRYDDGVWTELSNCSVNAENDVVTCETSHFSVFALFGTRIATTRSGGVSRGSSSSGSGRSIIIETNNREGSSTPRFIFTKNLRLGNKDEDVRRLQEYLNLKGFLVAKNSFGSPGLETNYFGNLTFNALKEFQKAKNLPSTGFFGPMTRNIINLEKN